MWRMTRTTQIFFATGFGLLLAFGLIFFTLNFPARTTTGAVAFGATFSTKYAESLGLDWKEVYGQSLDDLGIREYRIPAYWDRTEPRNGEYDFSDVDYQLDEASKRGAKVLLAVGRKLPRWPECHEPMWVRELPSPQDRETELLAYIRAVVERYRANPVVYAWQVENEPFFPFGDCPAIFPWNVLKTEVDLVNELDPSRPLIVTESGEWSPWVHIGYFSDIIGVSMYREAWNDTFGYVPFPIGPGWYQLRDEWVRLLGKQVVVTELQVEPWGPIGVAEMSAEQIRHYMPLVKMRDNIAFAKDVGINTVYVWGVETWYLARQIGAGEYWDEGKRLFGR